VLKTII